MCFDSIFVSSKITCTLETCNNTSTYTLCSRRLRVRITTQTYDVVQLCWMLSAIQLVFWPSLWLATHLFLLLSFLLLAQLYRTLLLFAVILCAPILCAFCVHLNWFPIKLCIHIVDILKHYDLYPPKKNGGVRATWLKRFVIVNCVYRTFVLLHTILRFYFLFVEYDFDDGIPFNMAAKLKRPTANIKTN